MYSVRKYECQLTDNDEILIMYTPNKEHEENRLFANLLSNISIRMDAFEDALYLLDVVSDIGRVFSQRQSF